MAWATRRRDIARVLVVAYRQRKVIECRLGSAVPHFELRQHYCGVRFVEPVAAFLGDL